MMKGSAKPISSPGRREKFPPPLMRFLRTNVGSRSRGRSSRASPMFMRKKNSTNNNGRLIEEPSSPKVTCIGQVRVKRSKKQNKKKTEKKKKPCWWIRKSLFQVKLHRPKSCFSALKKWVMCFRCGYHCRRVETVESSSRVESTQCRVMSGTTTCTESGIITTSPPKNALVLTRCRSAPYRSSSLASRFWGSPLNSSQETVEKPNPILPNEDLGPTISHESKEMEACNGEKHSEVEEKKKESYAVHPLILTRCKSEPAKTGERLNPIPDSLLWMQRRSTETASQT